MFRVVHRVVCKRHEVTVTGTIRLVAHHADDEVLATMEDCHCSQAGWEISRLVSGVGHDDLTEIRLSHGVTDVTVVNPFGVTVSTCPQHHQRTVVFHHHRHGTPRSQVRTRLEGTSDVWWEEFTVTVEGHRNARVRIQDEVETGVEFFLVVTTKTVRNILVDILTFLVGVCSYFSKQLCLNLCRCFVIHRISIVSVLSTIGRPRQRSHEFSFKLPEPCGDSS
ncbi:hypothetical protein D3C86_1340360 [compost metagenome]